MYIRECIKLIVGLAIDKDWSLRAEVLSEESKGSRDLAGNAVCSFISSPIR